MIFEENKKELYFENEKRFSFIYEGIICVFWKAGVAIEASDAEDTMRYSLKNYNKDGRELPTFVELTDIESLSREARDVFQNQNTKTSSALALVVSSMMSRVIGNIFITMNQSGIPLKLFNSRDQAFQWLKAYR